VLALVAADWSLRLPDERRIVLSGESVSA
jgi:hypothetical protein